MSNDTVSESTTSERPERLLTFASGGWVIALSGLFCAAAVGFHLWLSYQSFQLRGGELPSSLATNGFDLSTFDGDLELLSKRRQFNELPALNDPAHGSLEQVLETWKSFSSWGKPYLVDSDLVIGVTIGDESRAYPIRVLQWHETANDEVGGIPILVSFNSLSRSAAVYDRRLGDETLSFASSGLIYNSNSLYSDNWRDRGDGSLWVQAMGECVHGPRKGEQLRVLPSELVTLGDWMARHPESTVIPGQQSLAKKKRYESGMEKYYFDKTLMAKVDPMPGVGDPEPFANALVLYDQSGLETRRRVVTFDEVRKKASDVGVWESTIDGFDQALRFVYEPATPQRPETLRAETLAGKPVASATMLYFTWYAFTSG